MVGTSLGPSRQEMGLLVTDVEVELDVAGVR
jgi:hypothetical protein